MRVFTKIILEKANEMPKKKKKNSLETEEIKPQTPQN